MTKLTVAVMGAGAVGCYYGGMLARAGHSVTLVARPAHVERSPATACGWRPRASTSPCGWPPTPRRLPCRGPTVLFCVKSGDTESAGAQMRPYLADGTLVLCLQNGVDNADRLRAVAGNATSVAAAVVYVATEMPAPGQLRHHGRGELVIEPSPRSSEVAQALAAADVPTEITDKVRGALWAKLILNCAYNAISAIAQQPYGVMVEGEGIRAAMQDAVREREAVAQAEGVQLPGDIDALVAQLAGSMPHQLSSTAQDLARGKRTEIDYLNGLVVRHGEALGIPTPVNRLLWALVKLMEGSARETRR